MAHSTMTVHLQSALKSAQRNLFNMQSYKVANIAISATMVMVLLMLFMADVQPALNVDENRVSFLGIQLPGICIYHHLLGRPCPSCGMTRSIISLLDGNVEAATKFHPSGVWILLWIVAQIGLRLSLAQFSEKGRLPWLSDLSLSFVTMIVCIYLPLLWS